MNSKAKAKAIFLDRDGVINIDKQYVSRIEDFEFQRGIFELLRFLQDKGYLLIIVTNQSGIGRGYYTQQDFDFLTKWKLEQLEDAGIHITKIYHCPHAPEKDCNCRKPAPGMLLAAQKEFDIDMQSSWMIGDKKSDIDAGKNAGIGKTVFVSKDKCREESGANFCVKDIGEIAELVKRYG
jgi:D-glycero-D-manno-heptose 1,7-bisphosphate phosphatase